MSYAIAPTFEGNKLGQRRLSLRSGVGGVPHGLGDSATDQYVALLTQGGYDAGTINTLVTMGATADQLAALYDGSTDVPTLMLQLQSTPQFLTPAPVPLFSSPSQPAPPLPAPPSSPAPRPGSGVVTSTATGTQPASAQSPPGSTLSSTVTFNPAKAFVTASQVIDALNAQLPAQRMALVSSYVLSSGIASIGSFQVTIFDSVGHAYLTDVKTVLDALVNLATQNGLISSTVPTVISTGNVYPTGGGGTLPLPNFAVWFEQNWSYIAAFLAAVVILPPIIKKL